MEFLINQINASRIVHETIEGHKKIYSYAVQATAQVRHTCPRARHMESSGHGDILQHASPWKEEDVGGNASGK
jgi:hypothetical protein